MGMGEYGFLGFIARYPHQGYCIDETERCNGFQDCADHSDETGCNGTNCRHELEPAFVCLNGKAVDTFPII